MSLEEARNILGQDETAEFSDEQLQKLIYDLEAIARETIKAILYGDFEPDKPLSIV